MTLLDYGPNVITNISHLHHVHPSMVAVIRKNNNLYKFVHLVKERLVRPSEITPGNRYHCFPYFRSKQCYVVSLVDCETNVILQPTP